MVQTQHHPASDHGDVGQYHQRRVVHLAVGPPPALARVDAVTRHADNPGNPHVARLHRARERVNAQRAVVAAETRTDQSGRYAHPIDPHAVSDRLAADNGGNHGISQ